MTIISDYANRIHIDANPEKVFDVLTTAEEFAAWWMPADGSGGESGQLRVRFDGIDEPLTLQVTQATRASKVAWVVESCAFLPDWVGTRPTFLLSRSAAGGCDLEFRHEGLTSQLDCYEMCRAGWDQYLPSLRDYLQTSTGNPFSRNRLG